MQKNKIIIRIVAALLIATGLFQMFRYGLDSYLNLFAMFFKSASLVSPWFWIICTVLILTPILKLVSAIGLTISKRWGWVMAIVVLVFDFLMGFQAAVRMSLFALRTQRLSPPVIPDGSHVQIISMWPSYVIAIMGVILIFVLIRQPVMKQFKKQAKLA